MPANEGAQRELIPARYACYQIDIIAVGCHAENSQLIASNPTPRIVRRGMSALGSIHSVAHLYAKS